MLVSPLSLRFAAGAVLLAGLCCRFAAAAEPVVPGTGTESPFAGDDFEDENWQFVPNNPKSTYNLDKFVRTPGGFSRNGRWYEGAKRGQPDVVRRVETPEGGLPGSRGALLLASRDTGIPGQPSGQMQQDDYIADCRRLRNGVPVELKPSVTTRVFLPPVAEWERRPGAHFAFRLAVTTVAWHVPEESETGERVYGHTTYWPGFFLEFEPRERYRREEDFAYWRIRAGSNGGDFRGPQVETTGWWTLGMSVTPDGMVHYYAKPGVEDLTEADYITSQYPYGYRAHRLSTFFYNTCSADNGRTWSTPFVVDDPKIYYELPAPLAEGATSVTFPPEYAPRPTPASSTAGSGRRGRRG